MIKMVMQDNKVKFIWNGNDCTGKYIELIEQYHYDSEEERNEHTKQMIEKGFKDSGQIKENVGSFYDPVYVWFGNYYKTIRE